MRLFWATLLFALACSGSDPVAERPRESSAAPFGVSDPEERSLAGAAGEGANASAMQVTESKGRTRKLRGASLRVIEQLGPEEVAAVIIKVSVPDYAPPGVEPTAWMGRDLCTARVRADQIEAIEADPQVISIEVSRPIQAIEPR